MALTIKRKRFIDEYLKNGNATRAAGEAGYKGVPITLASVGHELLKNEEIQEAIEQCLQNSAMTRDEVLMRLARIARGENTNAKPADVLRALELIGKYWGLFTDRIEHTVPIESTLVILPAKDL